MKKICLILSLVALVSACQTRQELYAEYRDTCIGSMNVNPNNEQSLASCIAYLDKQDQARMQETQDRWDREDRERDRKQDEKQREWNNGYHDVRGNNPRPQPQPINNSQKCYKTVLAGKQVDRCTYPNGNAMICYDTYEFKNKINKCEDEYVFMNKNRR